MRTCGTALGCAVLCVLASGDLRADPAGDKPFILDARLRVQRTVGDTRIMLGDVHSCDTVLVHGDRLQLSIRTSQKAYLYLAYCSQSNPRFHGLTVFPERGSIEVPALTTTVAPARREPDQREENRPDNPHPPHGGATVAGSGQQP